MSEPETAQKHGDGKGGNSSKDADEPDNSNFECNICLCTASDAVISMCGHLFCWPCLHRWLETRPHKQLCPVCKAAISKDKVIPLYGRGKENQKDPRDKIPDRPQGQRTEPDNNNTFNAFNLGGDGGFQMSFGIGAFPFGFFTSNLNLGEMRQHPAPAAGTQSDEQFLSRVFIWVAAMFILWLLVA